MERRVVAGNRTRIAQRRYDATADARHAPICGNRIAAARGIIPSPDALPALDDPSTVVRTLVLDPPVNALEFLADLKTKFSPQDTPVGGGGGFSFDDRVRKALPDTYTALLPPGAPRDPDAQVPTTSAARCTPNVPPASIPVRAPRVGVQ